MLILTLIVGALVSGILAEEPITEFTAPASSTEPTESGRAFTTKFVGEPIPANCTAFYSCCDASKGSDEDCYKWCVKKVACNKRLVLVKVPSYVEIVTPAPEDLEPASVEGTTDGDVMVEPSEKPMFGVKGVQIIDVPCRAGSLPDRRGRCREVW